MVAVFDVVKPAIPAEPVMSSVAEPTGSDGIVQTPAVNDPRLGEPPSIVNPVGRASATVIPVAVLGPAFVIVT